MPDVVKISGRGQPFVFAWPRSRVAGQRKSKDVSQVWDEDFEQFLQNFKVFKNGLKQPGLSKVQLKGFAHTLLGAAYFLFYLAGEYPSLHQHKESMQAYIDDVEDYLQGEFPQFRLKSRAAA